MNRRRISLVVLTVILACARSTEPLPTGPVVLLQTYYRFGPCAAAWTPSTPPVQTTVVDFHFELSTPTAEQIKAIERRGGVVLNTLEQTVVRVVIDVSTVSVVMAGPAKPYFAETVPDTTNHLVTRAHYFCAVGQ